MGDIERIQRIAPVVATDKAMVHKATQTGDQKGQQHPQREDDVIDLHIIVEEPVAEAKPTWPTDDDGHLDIAV